MSDNIVNIGDAITGVFRNLGMEKEFIKARVITEWKAVIGNKIAGKVKAEKFEGDVLILKTESSAWKNEISLRKKELIKKINAYLKSEIVKDIKTR